VFQILSPNIRGSFADSPLGQRLFEAITGAISNSQISIEVLQLGHIEDNKHLEDISLEHRINRIHQPPMISTRIHYRKTWIILTSFWEINAPEN
jgi:hypothetical protein